MGIPMILAFNFDDAALSTLHKLCVSLKLRCKPVPAEGFAMPLGAMVGIPVATMPSASGTIFIEPMLVMCNLDESQFNTFLQGLRFSPLPHIDLKAVLTPTNVAWNAFQLHEELSKERDAMRRARDR